MVIFLALKYIKVKVMGSSGRNSKFSVVSVLSGICASLKFIITMWNAVSPDQIETISCSFCWHMIPENTVFQISTFLYYRQILSHLSWVHFISP